MLQDTELICTIYRSEKTAKNVLQCISLLKTSNINTDHKSKMVGNKSNNMEIRTVQFTNQKKSE